LSASTSHREGRSAELPIKRRTNVVGIFPNDAAIVRLVGSQLQEQQEEWQLERRRFFSEATMAKIPEPEEPLELMGGDQAEQAAAAIN
jgi:putative transposase